MAEIIWDTPAPPKPLPRVDDPLAARRAQRDAELRESLLPGLRADVERVLRDEPLSPDDADEMLDRHDQLGISAERFVELVEIARDVRQLETNLGDDAAFEKRMARDVDELSKLIDEHSAAESRANRLKGRIEGLRCQIPENRKLRKFDKEDLAAAKAKAPELFPQSESAQ